MIWCTSDENADYISLTGVSLVYCSWNTRLKIGLGVFHQVEFAKNNNERDAVAHYSCMRVLIPEFQRRTLLSEMLLCAVTCGTSLLDTPLFVTTSWAFLYGGFFIYLSC